MSAFVGSGESRKHTPREEDLIEQRYEKFEVVGPCKKNHRDRNGSDLRPQESERLALLGTMAAVFAHEVGNPLAGISLSLKCVDGRLEEKQVDDPALTSMIRDAIGEIDRLASLLKEFRALAPEQTLDLKSTHLVKIAEEALALEMIAYRAAGITVKFAFEDALPMVRLDAAKIKQVILNLCKNAVEAMPDGGCLTLKGYRSRGMVVLEISDDGVGVPHNVNIFELFKTTKPGGTGLGLPLVQQIVSAHNGSIAYKSEPGRGATFKVSLAHV
jgi:signal transduction histidine kinase